MGRGCGQSEERVRSDRVRGLREEGEESVKGHLGSDATKYPRFGIRARSTFQMSARIIRSPAAIPRAHTPATLAKTMVIPTSRKRAVKARELRVVGERSPYPTVDMVTFANGRRARVVVRVMEEHAGGGEA